MAQQLFKNNAGGAMSGTLAIGGTTLNMAAGQGARFPAPSAGEYFLLTIFEKDVGAVEFNYEVVKVTARVADSMTIERDFEGMVVAAGGTSGGWAYPSAPGLNPSQVVYVDLRYTAYGAGNTLTKDDNLASVASAATARSNIGAEEAAKKNATGGYPGLSGFALQLKNAANTFTNLLTNATTAIRTWTLPDYDGTLSTLAGAETLTNKTLVAPALGTPASGDATNLTNTVAPQTHAATSKATPVDADEIPLSDSAATFGLKKLTWANLKATLKTYFDTLYQAVGTYVTPTTLSNGTLPASVTTLTASGNATLGDAEATDTHTVKGATTVLADSASPAVKITQTGSGNAFTVEDVASDTTPFVIDEVGRVILGNPIVITGSQLETHGVTDAFKFSADSVGQFLRFFKGRGTAAAPWTTTVTSGDNIASLDYYGADGAGPILAARITAAIDGTPGTNDMPGRLVFSTTADGAASPTERMRIDSSGNVGIGASAAGSFKVGFPISGDIYIGKYTATSHQAGNASRLDLAIVDGGGYSGVSVRNSHDGTYSSQEVVMSTSHGGIRVASDIFKVDKSGNAMVIAPYGGLGYGTGAGGTVTQATSKVTAVTLNKPTGQITMDSSALAASTTAVFTLTNSVLAGTDLLLFSLVADGVVDPQNYNVWSAVSTGGGTAQIHVRNISGGSLSQAVKLRFAVLKSVSA